MFVKTPNTARGAVGVITYELDCGSQNLKTLAVMFSVPYDFNIYLNWFAVGIFSSTQKCDYDLYYHMYYKSDACFQRAQGGQDITLEHGGIVIQASMTNTYKLYLTVRLQADRS